MLEFSPFSLEKIFNLNLTNYDSLTENFQFDYYLYYFLNFRNEIFSFEYNEVPISYLMGRVENQSTHISILTVANDFRSQQIGNFLMKIFEQHSSDLKSEFVDLFVRKSSVSAIRFYKSRNYYIYREIYEYYSCPVESAYDMRLSLIGENKTSENIHSRFLWRKNLILHDALFHISIKFFSMFDLISTQNLKENFYFKNEIGFFNGEKLILNGKEFPYKNGRKINLICENFFIALRNGRIENLITKKSHNIFNLAISMEFFADNLFLTDSFNRLFIFDKYFSIVNIFFEISAVFKIENDIFYLSSNNFLLNEKFERKFYVELPSRIFKIKIFENKILFFHKEGCTVYENFKSSEMVENVIDMVYCGNERSVIYKDDRIDELFDYLYK